MNFKDCNDKCNELKVKLLKTEIEYNNNKFIVEKIFPLPTEQDAKIALINIYSLNKTIETNRFINNNLEVGLLLIYKDSFEIMPYLTLC